MSDNIDPQQINDLNENLRLLNETLSNTSRTKGTGTDAAKDAKDAVGNTLGELLGMGKKASGAFDALGSSTIGLAGSLYKGEKGAQVFSNALEALSIAIMLIPGLGQIAKIASLALYAFAKTAGAVTKQGDELYKTYQDLSRVGATASTGIQGVFANMQKFGYGIEELNKMVQLVTENSETLAKFSLTAADGANAFSMAMTDLVRDPALKVLGKQPDELNKAGAAFIRQTVAAGISQKTIGDQLQSQTVQYIVSLDRLQRLTGLSGDALQKQQDEAMAEDAYNDVMSELKQRALSGDAVAQAQIDKITTVMAKMGPEMRKEFMLSLGGDISAGSKLFMTIPSLMGNVMNESVSLATTMNAANRDATNSVNTFGKSFRLGAGAMRESFVGLNEQRQFMVGTADFDERTAAAKKNAIVTDEATKNLAEVDLANMNSRDALQSFVQLGVQPATNALRVMANIARGGTGLLPGQGVGGRNSFENQLSAFGTKGTKGTKTPEGLDSELANAVTKAIAEYKQVTGKTATITSGVRDREKQERMYNEYVANGRKGKPVAPPGRSLHETGNAVDINTADANEMDRLGILKKHGLNRPIANDPVHVQLANVNRGYQNTLRGVEPNKTIPHTSPSTATAPNPMATNQSDGIMAVISQHLASLSYSNQQIESTVKKSLQRQQ